MTVAFTLSFQLIVNITAYLELIFKKIMVVLFFVKNV